MRKPKKRPPHHTRKVEQEVLARRQEAKRQGRVAFHFGKSRESCPFAEGDPLGRDWLTGLAQAGKRTLRGDMSPARAKGYNAFRDGLLLDECPLGSGTDERTEWLAGWERARVFTEQETRRFR